MWESPDQNIRIGVLLTINMENSTIEWQETKPEDTEEVHFDIGKVIEDC